MKKITILYIVLAFNVLNAQTIFDWDTNATANFGTNATEEIGGITVTTTDDANNEWSLENLGAVVGSTADILYNGSSNPTTITFTFSEPVDVNSIFAIEANALANEDYTFIPDGDNSREVVATLTGGSIEVALNWVNVTSFTVTKTGNGLFGFDNLSVSSTSPTLITTVFDWDTNVTVTPGTHVTEEIDGITVTATTDDDGDDDHPDNFGWLVTGLNGLPAYGNVLFNGSSANTMIIFTFSKPVDVNSIFAIEGGAYATEDYTFIPDGDMSREVVATLTGGYIDVALNWVNVMSFTVTKTGSGFFAFDNLSVSSESLSVDNPNITQKALVYPNPVESMLYIQNVSDLKYINVYNNLGQMVLKSSKEVIDVSHLSKGLYFLQIHTHTATETKRIIKK